MIVLHTRINNGKMSSNTMQDILNFAKAHDGKMIEIGLKKARSKRSERQNSFYWGAVIPIVQDGFKSLGYILSKDETHEIMKERFIEPVAMVNGDEFLGNKRPSTTEMTKTEFGEFIAKIQQFGSEILNVYIPDPLEQTTLI